MQRRINRIPELGGYINLDPVALAFGSLQVWWIGSNFWKRVLARPQSGGDFRQKRQTSSKV